MTALTETTHATALATVKNTPRSQRHLIAHIDAADDLMKAADFYAEAALLIAEGAPKDCPEVARLMDFGQRKAMQGGQRMA